MQRFSTTPSDIHLPALQKLHLESQSLSKASYEVRKEKFYKEPKLRHIRYEPIVSPVLKEQGQILLMDSYILNKNFHEVRDERKEFFINKTLQADATHAENFRLPRVLVGKEAAVNYYSDYKRIDKLISSLSPQKENRPDPGLAMLERTERLRVMPRCLGLVKPKGEQSIVNVSNYKMGDKYIDAMSAGLKASRTIEKCILSSNRMTDQGLKKVVDNLPTHLQTLDLSHNDLKKVDMILPQVLSSQGHYLRQLLVGHNNLTEQSILGICRNAAFSSYIKVLNLNSNKIGPHCGEAIRDMIKKTPSLEELYIGCNFLGSASGEIIFTTLAENKNIRVLDLSLNQLAEGNALNCAKAASNCFARNKTLCHIDLSRNSFLVEASKFIATGLSDNHSIYGFHFEGNFGYIDSRGFLICEQTTQETSVLTQVAMNEIRGYEVTQRRKHNGQTIKHYQNVCWICEGWREKEFTFKVPEDFKDEKKFVYLHFDFEEFEPRLINLTDQVVHYKAMVPPRRFRYFFSFQKQQHLDQNVPTTTNMISRAFNYKLGEEDFQFQVRSCNEVSLKRQKIADETGEIIVSVLPRNNALTDKKEKDVWTYDKSAWAREWRLENEELLKQCFERDWRCSKIPNLVKNPADQEKVKEMLLANYKSIKDTYRVFSSWSPFGDVWAVSSNAFTEYCSQVKILTKETPLKIIDLTFITTNSISGGDWKGNQQVPERGLVRFQFMECLVRLSEERYKKTGLVDNMVSAVSSILKEHVAPYSQTYSNEKWRNHEYFCQQNDRLIKKYRQIFNAIYKRNSHLKVKPGEKPYMCLAEFRMVIERISQALILERDIFLSFNLSMMTQIDELENVRFMRMTEIEFIEAIARCAFLLPISCKLPTASSASFPHKFEWLIHELRDKLCPEDIRNQFEPVSILTPEEEEQ